MILEGRLRRHIPKRRTIPNKNVKFVDILAEVHIILLFFHVITLDFVVVAGGSPETTTAGVSALHGVQLQGFYPMQLPQLTPGLSQFVNNDLTEHVRGWPAEACERQVSE